ncbi:hypothetical protein [Cupriavidus sp. D39]|uniref:hypothetical protein n=1 Tax=Cupriavidus sp. D39 TaxID=2997877 RepID=UPI003B637544
MLVVDEVHHLLSGNYREQRASPRTVTSNSPTCGRLNSPRQDGQIMNRPSQKQQAWWRLL